MGRRDGSTQRRVHRRTNAGHRMHRRGRLARLKARVGKGRLRTRMGWGRWGAS